MKEYNEGMKKYLKNLNKFMEKGDYESAERECREAIKMNPNSAEAHWYLGSILHVLGRYEEAEKEFREAIKIKPNFSQAHYNLGILLYELGRYEEARMEYEMATKSLIHKFFYNFFEMLEILPSIEKNYFPVKTPAISSFKYQISYLLLLLISFILFISIIGIFVMKYRQLSKSIVLSVMFVIIIGIMGIILFLKISPFWFQLFSEGNVTLTPSGIHWIIKEKEGYIDFNSDFTVIKKQAFLWGGRNREYLVVYEIKQGENKIVFHRTALLREQEEIADLPYTNSVGVRLIQHAKEITDYIDYVISQKEK
jgi:tetratricopeptide (TPR) repeat protein